MNVQTADACTMSGMRTLPELTKQIELDRAAHAGMLYAKCIAAGQPLHESLDPRLDRIKAAVTGMTSTSTSALRQQLFGAFLNVLVSQTLLGRMLGWTPAPPGQPMAGMANDGPAATWNPEGTAMPVVRMDQRAPRTDIAKFGILLPFSSELVKLTDSRAERLFERQLLRQLRRAEDTLLLDDNAAVSEEKPEGLLYGLSSIATTSPMRLDADIVDLFTAVVEGEALFPYFIVSPRGAMWLAMQHVDGAPLFPSVGPTGGTIAGVPVLTSPAAGSRLILVAAEHLVVTDEGIEIERARHASIQMDSAPTTDITTPTATSLVSAWQAGMVVLRAIRYLHWTKLRANCAAFLELPISGSPA